MCRNWSTDQDLVPFPNTVHGDLCLWVRVADSGGINKNLVSLTTLDHLGISGNYLYTCFLCSPFDRFHNPQELVHFQAFLNNKTKADKFRDSAAHSNVVYGTIHSQFTDIPPSKKDGGNHKTVR